MRLRWGRIISIFLVFILLIGVGIYFIFFNKKEEKQIEETDKQEPVIEKKLQILDLESDSRPIAVMINNHKIAQPYQTGLNDAYLVYEMIVEGGITRMMAVFKDKDTATIGTVRSSRHYFLDYAQENDAIYTHFGWSEKAKQDINDLNNFIKYIKLNPLRSTKYNKILLINKYLSLIDMEAYKDINNIKYKA